MEKGKNMSVFIEFKIRNAQEEGVSGLVIHHSNEWTLLANNVVDYVIDGYLIIRNDQIANHFIHRYSNFRSIILNKKCKHIKHPKINLNSSLELFKELFRKKKVFSISNFKKDSFAIGRIKSISETELLFELLSTKAKWLKAKRVKFSDVHVIAMDTDYINSLLLIADT